MTVVWHRVLKFESEATPGFADGGPFEVYLTEYAHMPGKLGITLDAGGSPGDPPSVYLTRNQADELTAVINDWIKEGGEDDNAHHSKHHTAHPSGAGALGAIGSGRSPAQDAGGSGHSALGGAPGSRPRPFGDRG